MQISTKRTESVGASRGRSRVASAEVRRRRAAATAFAFLLVSEHTPLFGFMEPGYDPPAIMASRVAELATVGLLGSFLLARVGAKVSVGRW
jgi:hypothetical protein